MSNWHSYSEILRWLWINFWELCSRFLYFLSHVSSKALKGGNLYRTRVVVCFSNWTASDRAEELHVSLLWLQMMRELVSVRQEVEMLLSVPYLRPLQRYSDLQQSSFEHLQHISRQLQSDLDCLAQVAYYLMSHTTYWYTDLPCVWAVSASTIEGTALWHYYHSAPASCLLWLPQTLICSLGTGYLERYTCFHPWFCHLGYLQNCV